MKKLILLLMILFAVGCITVVEEASKKEVKEVPPAPLKDVVTERVIRSAIPEVAKAEEKAQPLNPAIEALKARADSKVRSYSFIYAQPPDNIQRDSWYIKGNRIKVEIFAPQYFNPASFYDSVYIDAEKKTAAGYCTLKDEAKCPVRNRQFILDYDEVMIKTPYQIVKAIPYGELIGSELLWDRMYQVVKYKKDNIIYKAWVDSYSGLAAKLAMIDEDGNELAKYEFRHLQINNVDDAKVEPPRI